MRVMIFIYIYIYKYGNWWLYRNHIEGATKLEKEGSLALGGMFISTYLPTYPAVPAGPNVPRIYRTNYETLWKGAMFNSHPKEGETPSFKGSAMMVLAENEGEVRKILENDIYSRSGVWDLENMQIIPVCFLFFSFLFGIEMLYEGYAWLMGCGLV